MVPARPAAALVVLLAVAASPAQPAAGLATPPKASSPTARPPAPAATGRGPFLAALSRAACLALLPPAAPAHARDVDPAVRGTKADPDYQLCLSQCVYTCTKPKGAEFRSRAECLPECKASCATTKAQLLRGTPVKK